MPTEESVYDPAQRCSRKETPGMLALHADAPAAEQIGMTKDGAMGRTSFWSRGR